MSWDQIADNWVESKKSISLHWEKITDGQLDVIAGRRDRLAGTIQVMYGIDRQEAEYQLFDWQENLTHVESHYHCN